MEGLRGVYELAALAELEFNNSWTSAPQLDMNKVVTNTGRGTDLPSHSKTLLLLRLGKLTWLFLKHPSCWSRGQRYQDSARGTEQTRWPRHWGTCGSHLLLKPLWNSTSRERDFKQPLLEYKHPDYTCQSSQITCKEASWTLSMYSSPQELYNYLIPNE